MQWKQTKRINNDKQSIWFESPLKQLKRAANEAVDLCEVETVTFHTLVYETNMPYFHHVFPHCFCLVEVWLALSRCALRFCNVLMASNWRITTNYLSTPNIHITIADRNMHWLTFSCAVFLTVHLQLVLNLYGSLATDTSATHIIHVCRSHVWKFSKTINKLWPWCWHFHASKNLMKRIGGVCGHSRSQGNEGIMKSEFAVNMHFSSSILNTCFVNAGRINYRFLTFLTQSLVGEV